MTKRIKSIIGNPDFFRGYRIGRRGVIWVCLDKSLVI
jgi:hypothetical protein